MQDFENNTAVFAGGGDGKSLPSNTRVIYQKDFLIKRKNENIDTAVLSYLRTMNSIKRKKSNLTQISLTLRINKIDVLQSVDRLQEKGIKISKFKRVC